MRETFRVNHGNSDSTCHVLPCKINHDGAIDTSMFKPVDTDRLEASFRGRPLVGQKVDLQGYTGVVFEKAEAKDDEGLQHLRVARKFDGLTVWEHGRAPDQDDMWAGRLEELISVSQALAK